MLEIQIFDKIEIADSLKKAILIILEAFKRWVSSNDKNPLSISVRKISNKSPPVLKINVKEEVKTKSAFGK